MKKSFSLIETLLSIVLFSIIISGFLNLSIESVDYKNHIDIQTLKNKIESNNFSSFSNDKINVSFAIENDTTVDFTSGNTYSKYQYTNNFKLTYYDIPKKEPNLVSKVFE